MAYTWKDKTVIRLSWGLSYANISTVTGSTHNLGFTLTDTQTDSTQGLQPRFLVKDGRPAYQAPPFVDPSFGNGRAMPWFQGQEATKAAGLPELQPLDPAPGDIHHGGRSFVQRQPRQPFAGGTAAVQRSRTQVHRAIRRDLAELAHRFRGGGNGRSQGTVPRLHRALGIQRHGAPGPAALSAVPGHRYLVGRRRSQRPFELPRRDDPTGKAVLPGPAIPGGRTFFRKS